MAAECATDPVENPLWWFAQEFYQREGVEAAVLELQNHWGIDVLLLLAVSWLSSEGFEWPGDDPDFEQGLTDYEGWRDHVIVPLRQIRCQLPKQELGDFRVRVKSLELESEQLGLAGLFSLLSVVEAEQWEADEGLAEDNLIAMLEKDMAEPQLETVMGTNAIQVLLGHIGECQR